MLGVFRRSTNGRPKHAVGCAINTVLLTVPLLALTLAIPSPCGPPTPLPATSARSSPDGLAMKRAPIDIATATAELRAAGCEPLEPYPGSTRKPWLVRCVKKNCPSRETPFHV